MNDQEIRRWVLNDPFLYQQARDFGGGGDNEMYDKLYDFIDSHRKSLIQYIKGH